MTGEAFPQADLSDLIEHIPAVLLRVSRRDGRWIAHFVTKNISTYGYEREEFLSGRVQWSDLVHPDDRALIMKQVEDYELHGIGEYRLYYRLIRKDGDCIPVTEFNTVSRNSSGYADFYDVVIIDNSQNGAGERLISDYDRQQLAISDLLMSLHDSRLDHALKIIMDRVGAYLDNSRVLLYQDDPDHLACKVVYEWCNADVPSIRERDRVIDYKAASRLSEMLQAGGAFLIDFGEAPDAYSREKFENEGLVASALFPVFLNGERYGFISFDDCVVERNWDKSTTRFLKNISNLVSTILVRQKAACDLELSKKTLETVLDNLDFFIYVVQPENNKIIFANKAFKSAFDESCEGCEKSGYLRINPETLTMDAPLSTGVHEVYCEKGDKWLRLQVEPISWIDGQDAMLVNGYDVTAQKKYADTVEKLAFRDNLTGLPNRHRCNLDLQQALQEAQAAARKGYLLFIDMDDFKVVNDCYGHDYGDGVLISFGEYLKSFFREPDKVFRFGGDEFIVIIGHQNASRVEKYLETLMERGARPWRSLDKEFYCTLSIGVVNFSKDNSDLKTIVKQADIAMYESKKRGKNTYSFYHNEFGDEAMQRSQTEFLLRRAMRDDFKGFEVFYQPIVCAATEMIVGAEALLRMYDDQGRLLLPEDFISLAEYLGFIVPIGEYALKAAANFCARINRTIRPDFAMTVNLSEKQFKQKDIVQRITSILDDADVAFGNVKITFDETTAVQNPERMIFISEELHKRGLEIVLDNFGGGNASFIHLHNLPIDVIKISPSFIRNVDQDVYARSFIDLIVNWAHSLKKTVCLNGAETPRQYAFCRNSGAEQVQGFYLYKPCRAEELAEML